MLDVLVDLLVLLLMVWVAWKVVLLGARGLGFILGSLCRVLDDWCQPDPMEDMGRATMDGFDAVDQAANAYRREVYTRLYRR